MRSVEKEFQKFNNRAVDCISDELGLDHAEAILWLLQLLAESHNEDSDVSIILKGTTGILRMSFTSLKKSLEEQECPKEMIQAQLDVLALSLTHLMFSDERILPDESI